MVKTEDRSIKSWAADDRPREKMIAKGKSALSNAELIAILIGSGQGGRSAVALAREILSECNDDLVELSKLSFEELTRHKGIGEAKAISIIAALELGRRRSLCPTTERPTISNSQEAYDPQEELAQPITRASISQPHREPQLHAPSRAR